MIIPKVSPSWFISKATSESLRDLCVESTNRPFNCSKQERKSNDIWINFVECSNVHNSDRSSNAAQSNFLYQNISYYYPIQTRS